jgi:ankyrin repeat protein
VVLKHIKDINKVYQGHTALTYACYDTSNLEIIKLLIDQGANVNIKGPGGDNALMNAIANESDIPQYLIQNTNIEINAQNNDGETVLHLAVENENLALIQLLLAETSIDQTIKNEDGLTAYDLAIVYRNRYGEDYLYDEIVSLLGNF